MNRLQLFAKLRSSFWFTPSVIVSTYVALAITLIELDSASELTWLENWPRLFGAGAEGSRAILSTVAGAMLSILGVTYSMTLVALVLASSQFSPRTLRNHMRSVVTQVTLGNFAGIFTYCLIVLRVIRSGSDQEFVPSLAVFFAFAMAIASVGFLIYFIHHIATSIQASTIIASIASETIHTIDRMFPGEIASGATDDTEEWDVALEKRSWHAIAAPSDGYIQSMDADGLLKIARESNAIVRMERGIGAFIVAGSPLFSLALGSPPTRKTLERLRTCYSLSRYRTVEQDPSFGIRQIVDIALKALSPGINDTSTAITCIDYLSAILVRLANRKFPCLQRQENGEPIFLGIAPNFDGLLGEALNDIRGSAGGNTAVIVRMAHAIEVVSSQTHQPLRLAALHEHLDRLSELARQTIRATSDLNLVEDRLLRAHGHLRRSFSPGELVPPPTPLPTA